MAFHLLDNKVIAMDTTGGAFLYDPDKQAVRPLPSHGRLKNSILSHAVGDNLYVIDRLTNGTGTRTFEALVFTPAAHGRWHWTPLPPPPPLPAVQDATGDPTSIDDPTRIESFAAVGHEGSKILVSASGYGDIKDCTHLFDAEKLCWSKRPVDWVLPFSGCAQYVPELNKLWFGISSREHGSFFCASDISSASDSQPPALHAVLEDTATRVLGDLDLISADAIYLGSGNFCVARIFATPIRMLEEKDPEQFAVMAGVEVTSSDGGNKVSTVECNSRCYVLNVDDVHLVL